VCVAEPAVAAAQQNAALAGAGHIGDHGLVIIADNLRPDRHLEHEVAPAGAGTVAPGATAPVLRAEMLLVAIIDQRVEVVLRDEDDVAALAAIAAVGPAELDELLAPEAHRAGAAIAALYIDLALVEEFHGGLLQQKRERRAAPLLIHFAGNGYSAASAGRTSAGGTIDI
jgi:hypothetical protein